MEAKKTLSADLTNKRQLFFSIGLVISMLFVITVFEWKTYDDFDLISFNNIEQTIFDETIEIPPTVQPPPPPPVVQTVEIIEITDEEEIIEEIEIDLDIEITEEAAIEEYVAPPEIEEEEADEIFTIVETNPVPVGGYKQFYEEVGKNIRYPRSAINMRIEGKVFVEFVVDKTGELTNLKVVKGISKDCNEEAIRVMESMPKWKPGKQRGRAVRVKMVIPITYKLADI